MTPCTIKGKIINEKAKKATQRKIKEDFQKRSKKNPQNEYARSTLEGRYAAIIRSGLSIAE